MVDSVNENLVDYFQALARLVANKPQRVRAGTLISNDAVSLEAGRQKGSIRAKRSVFKLLIEAIDEAAKKQTAPKKSAAKKRADSDQKLKEAIFERDGARGREISLLYEVFQLRKMISEITGANVFPIRPMGS
jgi:hypothetical protein